MTYSPSLEQEGREVQRQQVDGRWRAKDSGTEGAEGKEGGSGDLGGGSGGLHGGMDLFSKKS